MIANHSNYPKKPPQNLTDKEDSPRTGNSTVDEIISSYHRDLKYQRGTIDHLVKEFSSIHSMTTTESGETQKLFENINSDISTVNSELKQDQAELKNIKVNIEKLQTKKKKAPPKK